MMLMRNFLWQLAWRQLGRHPKRTLLTGLATSLTSALFIFMLAFQIGSYENMKMQTLSVQDGHGQFQHPEFADRPSLRHAFRLQPDWKTELAQTLPIQAQGFRIETFGLLSTDQDRHQGAMILAVEPQHEPELSTLPNLIQKGRFLNAEDQAHMVLGAGLAQMLNLKLTDYVQFIGQDRQGSLAVDRFQIVGLIESGMPDLDRQLAMIPLSYAQTLLDLENSAHRWVFITQDFARIHKAQADLNAFGQNHNLRYLNWQTLQPGLANAIELDYYSGFIWYSAILLIVVFILFNTLLMSVIEREREFALLLSLGLSHRQLGRLIQIETLIILCLGVGVGVLIGTLVTLYFANNGLTLPGTEEMFAQYGLSARLYPELNAMAVLFAPMFITISTSLLSYLLVWRVYRLTPLSGRHAI